MDGKGFLRRDLTLMAAIPTIVLFCQIIVVSFLTKRYLCWTVISELEA